MNYILVYLYIFCGTFSALSQVNIETFITFTPSSKEIGCMNHFKENADKVEPFNNYVLAKISETMYSERLDYMFRFFQNDRKPIDSIPSTRWLKQNPILNDTNFEMAFVARFKHMFPEEDSVQFKFIYKTKYILGFFGRTTKIGFDPELVVISTNKYAIVVYRGTDMMEGNRRGEWIGTDFHGWKTRKCATFPEGRVHKGFAKSTELIQPNLEEYLKSINIGIKPIWVTGHSLGGAMAILSAIQLNKNGFKVAPIHVYAAPNSIGNQKFVDAIPEKIKNQIWRFEFYLDPFPMLWTPGYASLGHRTWIMPDWSMMVDIPHRTFKRKDYKCKDCTPAMQKKLNYAFKKNLFKLPTEIHNHNPQWYTKALYHYLSSEEQLNCPDIDDSFPFIYYGWEESK